MADHHISFFLATIVLTLTTFVLHELAHGFTAYGFGDPTPKEAGRLRLWPWLHLDGWGSFILPLLSYLVLGIFLGGAKPMPFSRDRLQTHPKKFAEFAVIVAGPLVHLMAIFALALGLFLWEAESQLAWFCAYNLYIQMWLFLINLVPLPPLDGYHIFALTFPNKVRLWMERKVVPYSLVLLLFVVALLFVLDLFPYLGQRVHHLSERAAAWIGSGERYRESWGWQRMRSIWGL